MNARRTVRRRGQPLAALCLLMVSWVGARAALWDDPVIHAAHAPHAVTVTKARPAVNALDAEAQSRPDAPRALPEQHDPPVLHYVRPEPSAAASDPVAPPTIVVPSADDHGAVPSPRIAANHLLLLHAATSLPLDPAEAAFDASTMPARREGPAPSIMIRDSRDPIRWSADGWLLLRPGGNAFNAPGAGLPGVVIPTGFYGGSQAGLVLRYRLAAASPHRPTVYLRASSGIERPRGEELAVGVSLRPVPKAPLAFMAEARTTRTLSGTVVRPAAAIVSEFPPVALPLGTRGEAYLQAGYVGGRDATAFIDGQARIDHSLAQAGRFRLRAGAGAWGGAQRGASRLDIGPTATLSVPIGPVGSRLSADYRFRVAGGAAPGSGPVLTLSAGF